MFLLHVLLCCLIHVQKEHISLLYIIFKIILTLIKEKVESEKTKTKKPNSWIHRTDWWLPGLEGGNGWNE